MTRNLKNFGTIAYGQDMGGWGNAFWLRPELSLLATALLCVSGCGESHAGSSSGMTAAKGTAQPAVTSQTPSPGGQAAAAPASGAPQRVRDISFDTIKLPLQKGDNFKRTMITPQIESLVGQPIRLRGFILPSFKQHGLTQFVLVRDNMQCCFGPGAALYDCILVEMDEGQACDYSIRPVTVEGVFDVREVLGPDDRHLAIYHLQGSGVK